MRNKIILTVSIATILLFNAQFANANSDTTKIYFQQAYSEIKNMLEGKQPINFERAVFITENAYLGNQYTYDDFQNAIEANAYLIEQLAKVNDKSASMDFRTLIDFSKPKFDITTLDYTEKEKKEMYRQTLANWAIYTYLTDTTYFYGTTHFPFTYQFNDPFGMNDWKNSQVTNLLFNNQQGNCFALVSLFKILSDQFKSGAYICTAPQHIYIQHKDHKGDYYNVELATGTHPGDGSIQTLTYTFYDGIVSGISLRRLKAEKQNIALCLVNLGKSYEHKFKTKDNDFILQCAELALKYDTLNLNAMLLKEQVLEERVIKFATEKNIKDVSKLKLDKGITGTYKKLETQIIKLYELGYHQMPLYMQEMIMAGLQRKGDEKIIVQDRTHNPFPSIKNVAPEDKRYSTLSGGLFEEVHEKKKFEQYGRFTIDTEKKKIVKMESESNFKFLIDPVVFAWSVDPMAHKLPSWSPYAAFNNNPILNVDNDGNYAVSVHYNITYNTLIKLGYSKSVADNVAHHASVYADHPSTGVLYTDNATHATWNSYRSGIDYTPTANSQAEANSKWHSMMSDAEAGKGMTHTAAMERGLSFGWGNIFAQQGGQDLGKLGQGLHALQDAYAHKGASTDEHLGVNQSSANMVWNDMYGNTSQAELITKSAGVLLQLFEGKTSSLESGMRFDFSGMSAEQLKTTQGLFGKAGYNLNATDDKGFYSTEKIETTK